MESLDNLLYQSQPPLEPKPGMSRKVLNRIALQRLRRNLLVIGAVGMAATVALALRSNVAQMLGYAVHQTSIVAAHPVLFSRAVLDSVPWPIVASLVVILAGWLLLIHVFKNTSFARSAGTFSLTAFVLMGSSAAFAYSTTSTELSPAQAELRLIINGVGKPQITIGTQTFQFDSTMSDTQLAAFAELQRTVQLATKLAKDQGVGERYAGINEATVVSQTTSTLVYLAGGTSMTKQLSSNLTYAVGGLPQSQLTLAKGDLVAISENDAGQLNLISKLTHPASDYVPLGFTTTPGAHLSTGKCSGNTGDACPDLPAAYTLSDASNIAQPPTASDLIEIYGTITALNDRTVSVKTSSGHVWTVNSGAAIAASNKLGLAIAPGDHLRIELWLPRSQPRTYTITDPSQEAVPTIASNPSAYPTVRMLQLALKTPWHYGQDPQKY